MHPVFGLIEHDTVGRLKHLVGHFHAAFQAILLRHLLAERGLVVVKRGQTVQEFHVRVAGQRQHLAVNLIGPQQRDTLRPLLFGFAHRHPDIGIDEIRAFYACGDILGERDPPAGLFRHCLAFGYKLGGRPAALRRDQTQIQAHQRGGFQHRIAHVIARIARIDQRHLVKRFARQMLLHGEQIRQELRRVKLIGQAVPHRHARELRQRFDDFLAKTAILNAVIHAAQHAGGIFN